MYGLKNANDEEDEGEDGGSDEEDDPSPSDFHGSDDE